MCNLKVLLKHSARVDKVARIEKTTPLHVAAERGHVKVVKVIYNVISGVCLDICSQILLDQDAKINAADVAKMTPLHLAAERGHTRVVKVNLQCDLKHLFRCVFADASGSRRQSRRREQARRYTPVLGCARRRLKNCAGES